MEQFLPFLEAYRRITNNYKLSGILVEMIEDITGTKPRRGDIFIAHRFTVVPPNISLATVSLFSPTCPFAILRVSVAL
jgi:hypothetical protein